MKKILLLLPLILLVIVFLRNVYDKEVDAKKVSIRKRTVKKKIADFKLNDRQKSILSIMQSAKKHPMKYIENKIGNTNVRTLRRDLDKLQRIGLIKKFGSTKSAFYQKT